MILTRPDPQTIELSEIDPFVMDMMRRIPPSADPGDSAAARARLFSSPTHGADAALDEEWQEYIEPDLRQLFEAATEVVERDLAQAAANPSDGSFSLKIPLDHLRSWIHAMNQARLALTEKHGISEREMEWDEWVETDDEKRALILNQIFFYGRLQEYFLHQIESL